MLITLQNSLTEGFIRIMFQRFITPVVVVVALLGAAFSSGCMLYSGKDSDEPTRYYGSQERFVEFNDSITDSWHYVQQAHCSGWVNFNGWFATQCDGLESSEYVEVYLTCSYINYAGVSERQDVLYKFEQGYWSEVCEGTRPILVSSTTARLVTAVKPMVYEGTLAHVNSTIEELEVTHPNLRKPNLWPRGEIKRLSDVIKGNDVVAPSVTK